MNTNKLKGLIFDIQGHSIHDGPGSRTLVFLSGCPLHCAWCCNPEGLLLRQRLMFKQQLCSNCSERCVAACPTGAVVPSVPGGNPVTLNREQCHACENFDCAKACYYGALQISGRWFTVEELMRILNRDRQYWGSGGGVSFSGGEPLLQRHFIAAVLTGCREGYISTAVETTCHIEPDFLRAILPLVDWIFVDIKHMDPLKHYEAVGADNTIILSNIRMIAASGWKGRLIVRAPVIPGFNDSVDNAEATVHFVKEVGLKEINLLPFHRLGTSKYDQLGMVYAFAQQPPPPVSLLSDLAGIYESAGLKCWVGADTPF
jgi:glycyl-radical enzyme activating protein